MKGLLSGLVLTERENHLFEYDLSLKKLLGHFKTASLSGFGCQEMPLAVGAAGAVLDYLEENQKTVISHINSITPYSLQSQMLLDNATIRNLNLFPDASSSGPSLLGIIDFTVTAMGGRLIRRWLSAPLLDRAEIERRQEAVQNLVDERPVRDGLTKHLKGVQDLERLLGRIVCQRAGPRDLLGLGRSLEEIPRIRALLSGGEYWERQLDKLHDFGELVALLSRSLVEDSAVDAVKRGLHKKRLRPGSR